MTIENWGQHQNQQIKRICISDGHACSASVITYGAILQDLRTPDADGQADSITLNMPKLDDYVRDMGSMGVIAGRFANRIAFGRYTHNGKTIQLEINNGPHHLHGGSKGIGNRVWNLVDASEHRVTLGLNIAAYDDGYPGNLSVSCTYSFVGEGHLRLELKAEVSAPCPINLAQHSYFNLEGQNSDSIARHRLRVQADKVAIHDATGIPVHAINVTNTPFDFRNARSPTHKGELLALDNSFHLQGTGLRQVAELTAPESGRSMQLYSDQPELQVYTAHGLSTPFKAICLEPQCTPNAPNTLGIDCFYGPSRPYIQTTEYKFGTL